MKILTLQATRSFTNIDLSFCDPRTASSANWRVLESLYDSDHFPIEISINSGSPKIPFQTKRWRLNNANWEAYRVIIDKQVSSMTFSDNADIYVEQFSKIIIEAAEESVGYATITKHSKCVPWWNADCEKAVKENKRALNKYRKHRTEENFLLFKHLKARARRILKQSKKESWQTYVSTLTKETTSTELWNKIKAMKGHRVDSHVSAIKDINNHIVTNSEEIADLLATTFAEKSSDRNFEPDFLEYKNNFTAQDIVTNQLDNSPINLPISKQELLYSLSSSRNTAPGPDNIPFIFI